MKVSFILLAHEKPIFLKPLIETLLSSGSDVFVHYDLSSPYNLEESVSKWDLSRFPGKIYFADRVEVKWGEFSIVQATLNALYLAMDHIDQTDYFMLISGSCMPIKPIYKLERFLKNNNKDLIETVNAVEQRWVTDGIQEERWEYFHFFNWRYQKYIFDLSLKLQNKLRIKRALPRNHTPYIGSQWWCLRTTTIKTILNFIDSNQRILNFYKRTWVPDELFFQTMVGNLIPSTQIENIILTKYSFNSWGIPRVYYDDDFSELLYEEKYFARKISHHANSLKENLKKLCLINEDEYNHLLENKDSEYYIDYMNKKMLKQSIKINEWHHLATYHENVYDYIKSIPNKFIISISDNKNNKQIIESKLSHIQNTEIIRLNFNDGLQKHNWHLKIGDIAFEHQNKNLLWVLSKNELEVIEYFKWKSDVHILLFIDINNSDLMNINVEVIKSLNDSFCFKYVFLLDVLKEKDFFSTLSSFQSRFIENQYKSDLFYDEWKIVNEKSFKNLSVIVTKETLEIGTIKKLNFFKNRYVLDCRNYTYDTFWYVLDQINFDLKICFILSNSQKKIIDVLKWKDNLNIYLLALKLSDLNIEDRKCNFILLNELNELDFAMINRL